MKHRLMTSDSRPAMLPGVNQNRRDGVREWAGEGMRE
jgi:hypothetical protein